MAAGDPYLHSGLSPATDVSLYPSQAQGAGTTYNVSAAVVAASTVSVTKVAAHNVSAAVSGVGAVGVSTAVAHATQKPPYVLGGAGGGRFAVDLVIPAMAVDAVAAIKESHTATFDGRRAHEDELILVGAF